MSEVQDLSIELESTGPKGDSGSDGAAATIAIGTVTTGRPGSNAEVTNSGTSNAASSQRQNKKPILYMEL